MTRKTDKTTMHIMERQLRLSFPAPPLPTEPINRLALRRLLQEVANGNADSSEQMQWANGLLMRICEETIDDVQIVEEMAEHGPRFVEDEHGKLRTERTYSDLGAIAFLHVHRCRKTMQTMLTKQEG